MPPVQRLTAVMERLLGPGGCPWDREQTHQSLAPYLIEEAYEAVEAIDAGDASHLCEELGDLLLQIVFHAQLAKAEGRFDLEQVAAGIADKLVRRHPHVFADAVVRDAGEVVKRWEEIKQAERAAEAGAEEPPSLMHGIPRALPALLAAERVQGRAAEAGLRWPSASAALDSARREWAELEAAIAAGGPAAVQEELGDCLFALANVARWHGLDAEEALRRTVAKFVRRFKSLETRAPNGGPLSALSPDALADLWEAAKGDNQP